MHGQGKKNMGYQSTMRIVLCPGQCLANLPSQIPLKPYSKLAVEAKRMQDQTYLITPSSAAPAPTRIPVHPIILSP
jgi:hypothetical protein